MAISPGAIAGIAIAILVLLAAIAYFVYRSNKSKNTDQKDRDVSLTDIHDAAEKGVMVENWKEKEGTKQNVKIPTPSKQAASPLEEQPTTPLSPRPSMERPKSPPPPSIDRPSSPLSLSRPSTELQETLPRSSTTEDRDLTSSSPTPSSTRSRSGSNTSTVLRADVDLPKRVASLDGNKDKANNGNVVVVPRLNGTLSAVHWYRRTKADEITLKAGDPVSIYKTYTDGWCFGMNWRSGQSGIFPLMAISPTEAANLAQELSLPQTTPPADSPLPTPEPQHHSRASMLYSLQSPGYNPNPSLISLSTTSIPASLPSVAMASHWGLRELRPRSKVPASSNISTPTPKSPSTPSTTTTTTTSVLPLPDIDPEVTSLATLHFAALTAFSSTPSSSDSEDLTTLHKTAQTITTRLEPLKETHPVAVTLHKQAEKLAQEITPKKARVSVQEARKSLIELKSEVERFFGEVFTTDSEVPPVPPLPDMYPARSGSLKRGTFGLVDGSVDGESEEGEGEESGVGHSDVERNVEGVEVDNANREQEQRQDMVSSVEVANGDDEGVELSTSNREHSEISPSDVGEVGNVELPNAHQEQGQSVVESETANEARDHDVLEEESDVHEDEGVDFTQRQKESEVDLARSVVEGGSGNVDSDEVERNEINDAIGAVVNTQPSQTQTEAKTESEPRAEPEPETEVERENEKEDTITTITPKSKPESKADDEDTVKDAAE